MDLKTNEIFSILISISLISNEPKKLLEIKTLVKSNSQVSKSDNVYFCKRLQKWEASPECISNDQGKPVYLYMHTHTQRDAPQVILFSMETSSWIE